MPFFRNRRALSIEWSYCDPSGFMQSYRYFSLFDQASWHLFEAALGLNPHELANEYDIVGMPLIDVHATILKPIKFGDKIEITSRVAEFRRSSFAIEHKLARDGQPAAESIETRLWAKRDEATQKVGAIPIPPQVVARFGTT